MTSKERVLQREHDRGHPGGKVQGKADALDLAQRADGMDGTAIIAEEQKVPMFVSGADYSNCPKGAPIGEIVDGEVQIFTMITPVNTANYPGITPNTERSLYSLCHTTNPKKAKPFVDARGTSGMYNLDECCTENGHVWRNLYQDNVYRPSALPERWEDLGTVEEVQS